MCMAAPGPRCASDLKHSLARNKQRLANAIASGDDTEFNTADSERATLQFEYAGTKKGQAALATQIAATTDTAVAADLTSYKTRAREAYLSKIEALRTVEAATRPAPASPPAVPVAETPSERILRERAAHPAGSYLNPTRESIAAEVADEATLRDQIRHERDASNLASSSSRSASSYTGKGGKGGKNSAPVPTQTRPPAAAPAPTPSSAPTSAASYGGKNPKGGARPRPTAPTNTPAETAEIQAADARTERAARTSAHSYTRKGGK